MKKIIIVILLLNSLSQAKMFEPSLFKKKIVGRNIGKLSTELTTSSHIQKMALKDVVLNKTSMDVVSSVALAIANKSKFGDKLMATTALPMAVIRQYAKYGDIYLLTMKEFNKKSLALSHKSTKSLKEKFPLIPNINFKTSKEFNDKMVKTLQFTGKKGWEASQKLAKLAKAHPKSTAVAGLYAWYVTDPNSFFEQKDKLIASVGSTLEEGVSDVTKLTLGASGGIANGFMSVVTEKMTLSNIVVLLMALFAFVFWKLRSYITKYLKIKLDNGLEKATENSKGLL